MIRAAPYELVMPRNAWNNSLRPLLVEPGLVAVGRLRWQHADGAARLIAEQLAVANVLPTGEERPPLDDWLVMAVVAGNVERMADDLQRRLAPGRSQTLMLLVFSSNDRRRWHGRVVHEEKIHPLDVVRIVGPAPLLVSRRPATSERLPETQRWSRTAAALGKDVLRYVQSAEVILVGAGRNGSQIAFQLAALGVRRLRLIDADHLGVENLDGMPGLSPRDVGIPKVVALARRLVGFRPDLSVSAIAKSMPGADALTHIRRRPAELLVTAVDSDTPRLAASLVARETLTPHLDVATEVRPGPAGHFLFGDVRLMLPAAGCVACVGGLFDVEQTQYELAAPPGALRRGEPASWNVLRPGGSLITINSMTTAAAVQVWLDLVAGRIHTSFWQRLRWEPGQGMTASAGPVGAAADCDYCTRSSRSPH